MRQVLTLTMSTGLFLNFHMNVSSSVHTKYDLVHIFTSISMKCFSVHPEVHLEQEVLAHCFCLFQPFLPYLLLYLRFLLFVVSTNNAGCIDANVGAGKWRHSNNDFPWHSVSSGGMSLLNKTAFSNMCIVIT